MPLTQQTLAGASIRSFDSSIGWGGQESQLSVSLVEDPSNGDAFTYPSVGSPIYFNYEGFRFGGVVKSYRTLNATSGFPTFELILGDNRELLDGVQLIIAGFNGDTSSIPNLYNIYAYWENQSFGSSLTNASGIPWQKIRDALLVLTAVTPIQFKNYIFYIDLGELPELPIYYRVGGGASISLMDYITQLCRDGGDDFFFTLENVNGQNVFKLRTVSRRDQPNLGAISRFIAANTAGQAITSDYGAELRNETTSRVIVGGQVRGIYLQTQQSADDPDEDNDSRVDDTILQFWGLDEFGNVILPLYSNDIVDKHYNWSFNIPSRGWNIVGVGEIYPTNADEMRAALGGQAAWEIYLADQSTIQNTTGTSDTGTNVSFPNPHYLKFERFGLNSNLHHSIRAFLSPITTEVKMRALDIRSFAPLTGKILRKSGSFFDLGEENIARLYQFVSAYAQEYYGKKYMVRIPTILAAIESETGIVNTSVEPSTDGGFLDESAWSNAVNNNYLPSDINKLLMGANDIKIAPYVRYDHVIIDNTQLLDLSEISPDDIILEVKQFRGSQSYVNNIIREFGGTPPADVPGFPAGIDSNEDNTFTSTYAFIRCQIDPQIYYVNANAVYSPRVVMILPGRISTSTDFGDSLNGLLKEILTKHIGEKVIDTATGALIDPTTTAGKNKAKSILGDIWGKFGGEQLMYGMAGKPLTPDLVGAPIKSNVETYGPWSAVGAIGKVEFEQQPDLVPWNYGGFAVMNLVANAMVGNALTNQQQAEAGNIEVPGVPALSLGDILISGGPYVTNISVAIGTGGVTTTYRMETWTARYGKLAKSNIDRVTKLAEVAQMNRHYIRENSRLPAIGSNFYNMRENRLLDPVERRGHHTSVTYLCGENFTNSNGIRTSNIVLSPNYNVGSAFTSGNYPNKAFVTLDGIFRPFSTKVTATNISRFETPTVSGVNNRNVDDLNPYKVGNDINVYAKTNALPTNEQTISEMTNNGDNRAIALRAPLILSGWGYDINGKPVPNSGAGTNNFVNDHLVRSDLWKCGPLDARWNNDRKVWVAGGGGEIRRGVLQTRLDYRSTASASGIVWDSTLNKDITLEFIGVSDFLLPVGGLIESNTNIFYIKENDRNYVVAAACVVN